MRRSVMIDGRVFGFNRCEWRKMKRWLEVGQLSGVVNFLVSKFNLTPRQATVVLRKAEQRMQLGGRQVGRRPPRRPPCGRGRPGATLGRLQG